MMILDNKFEIGDTVYVVTDPEQQPYKIVQIRVNQGPSIVYIASAVGMDHPYYDFELSYEKNILMTTDN